MEHVHFVDEKLKSVKKDRLRELHELLERFHDKMDRQGTIFTDELLLAEAKRISNEHKLTLPRNFKFSHKWLLRFKCQRGIGQKQLHREARSACVGGTGARGGTEKNPEGSYRVNQMHFSRDGAHANHGLAKDRQTLSRGG